MNKSDKAILKGIKSRVANKTFTVKTKSLRGIGKVLPVKGLIS